MGKINGVHHIALKPCKELYEKTVNFYKDVLGCTVVRGWGEGDTAACMLSCGDNTCIEVLHGDNDGTEKVSNLHHIAFYVDEVDNFIEEVRAAGYKVTIEVKSMNLTPDYPCRMAFFVGPCGETIELFKELK